jgi:tRNA (guanine37-N1)-methyltransferase
MDEIDEEVSIGDFVMTGGEIAAAAIVDSVVRLLPGVLKKDDATEDESFMHVLLSELVAAVGETEDLTRLMAFGKTSVQLLEYPHYTRPEVWEGKTIPDVLLCGDPKKIRVWKLQQAYAQTKSKRPDLLSM